MTNRRLALVLALLVLGGPVAGCLGLRGEPSEGAVATATEMLRAPPGSDVEPTGNVKEFTLYLHPMPRHELYPGSSMAMWAFSLSDDPATATFPGPEIRVTEGDRVRVTFRPLVANFEHTIHWHGQHVPADMDGVPYVSQEPTLPGESFTYDWIATPAGTYWYHCHVDVQHHLDMGMYGPLIVEPQDPADDPPFDREVTLMLDEMDKYHLESGSAPAQNTPQSGDPYDWLTWAQRQSQDTVNRNAHANNAQTTANSQANLTRPQRDWYPKTYAPYNVQYNTFLINGFAFPYTPPVIIPDGGTLRVRLINAGDSVHAMHLHGHHFLVTHKDGILLDHPYWADSVLIGPGERYDFYVVGNNPGVWDFHDHMGTNLQNDHIWPGGMMTMMVYESLAGNLAGGGHGHGATYNPEMSPLRESGAWIRWYDALP